jgi:membrane fusion protein YbhG
MKTQIFLTLLVLISFASCNNDNNKSDAYGNFEAIETIVSAETAGKLIQLKIEEGQVLKANDLIAIIDTTQLYLKKLHLFSQKEAITTKISIYSAQIEIHKEQLNTLSIEKERLSKLIEDGAATSQKMDEIEGNENVLIKQIEAVKIQKNAVYKELNVLDVQLTQLNDQIGRCYIKSPNKGTVLAKYIEQNELAAPGKSICKIADISQLELRAYISGNQLSSVKIGLNASVLIDSQDEEFLNFPGTITWISSTAEFTPKIIQTREERVNLVYAIKVNVKNDGSLKIGMPGEVIFNINE